MFISITLNTHDGTVCVTRANNKQIYQLGRLRDVDALNTAIQQMQDLVYTQMISTTSQAQRQPAYA